MDEEATVLVAAIRIRTTAKPGNGVDRVRQTVERIVEEAFASGNAVVVWEDCPGEHFYFP